MSFETKYSDDDLLEANRNFSKKLYKSILYTCLLVLFTNYGLTYISSWIFGRDDFSIIISFLISIIFLIIYSTISIIEEIRIQSK